MSSPAMQSLFKREILESAQRVTSEIEDLKQTIAKSKQRLADRKEAKKQLAKQLHCNTNNLHTFVDAGGGSLLGDRFVEKCTKCGFENRV